MGEGGARWREQTSGRRRRKDKDGRSGAVRCQRIACVDGRGCGLRLASLVAMERRFQPYRGRGLAARPDPSRPATLAEHLGERRCVALRFRPRRFAVRGSRRECSALAAVPPPWLPRSTARPSIALLGDASHRRSHDSHDSHAPRSAHPNPPACRRSDHPSVQLPARPPAASALPVTTRPNPNTNICSSRRQSPALASVSPHAGMPWSSPPPD